ncbi:MAG: hypothetical protein JJV98_08185 [Desulfosarcina sp.]|nr:hypothetical protein [Desulfobacterales bacterium]
MTAGRKLTVLLMLTMVTVISALAGLPAPAASAAEEGTFRGTWIASGTKEPIDFAPGRDIFTYHVTGLVNLGEGLGEVTDYWSECVGLWDSQTGSTGRCVWRGLKGQKVYIALSGRLLEEGVKVTGEVVGGSGHLEGVQGTFTFTWSSVFINKDTGTLTAHSEDLAGSYRIP